MVIKIAPVPGNPKAVEFFAGGKKIENIRAEKIYSDRGKLTVKAVIVYDPAVAEKSGKKQKGEEKDDEVQGEE